MIQEEHHYQAEPLFLLITAPLLVLVLVLVFDVSVSASVGNCLCLSSSVLLVILTSILARRYNGKAIYRLGGFELCMLHCVLVLPLLWNSGGVFASSNGGCSGIVVFFVCKK